MLLVRPRALALVLTVGIAPDIDAQGAAAGRLAPRIPVPQVARGIEAFIPVGAEVVARAVVRARPDVDAPDAYAALLRRDERHALLIGGIAGDGAFEAWEWATFMDCDYCRDDPTAGFQHTLTTRGAVLSVTLETSSVAELTTNNATWRLRGVPLLDDRFPAFELIGQETYTSSKIHGTAARESVNLLTGETVQQEGALVDGRFVPRRTTRTTERGRARPVASEVPTAF